jgi:hypothetical protein
MDEVKRGCKFYIIHCKWWVEEWDKMTSEGTVQCLVRVLVDGDFPKHLIRVYLQVCVELTIVEIFGSSSRAEDLGWMVPHVSFELTIARKSPRPIRPAFKPLTIFRPYQIYYNVSKNLMYD